MALSFEGIQNILRLVPAGARSNQHPETLTYPKLPEQSLLASKMATVGEIEVSIDQTLERLQKYSPILEVFQPESKRAAIRNQRAEIIRRVQVLERQRDRATRRLQTDIPVGYTQSRLNRAAGFAVNAIPNTLSKIEHFIASL